MCDLEGKNPIWGHTQRLKNVLHVVRCAKHAPQRPKNNANPLGAIRKICSLCRKSAIFRQGGNFTFERGGVSFFKKVLILVQRPQHKSTSDSVGAPKTNHFGAILIEFGDTKKCYSFSGLEVVPTSSKKLIGGLSCMHKGQKCIQILWDH